MNTRSRSAITDATAVTLPILRHLEALGIAIERHGFTLVVRRPPSPVAPEVFEALRAMYDVVPELLAGLPDIGPRPSRLRRYWRPSSRRRSPRAELGG